MTATVNEQDDGSFVMVLRPDTAGDSAQLDMSDVGGTYQAPEFSMPNISDLISVSIRDTRKVAAGTSSAPGDNTNALAISALKDADTINGERYLCQFLRQNGGQRRY